MNQEQLALFEAAIVADIETHLRKGGKLIAYSFVKGNTRCPIACLLDSSVNQPLYVTATERMGFEVSDKELWDFIYGFDGSGRTENREPTYAMGQKLRQRYLP